MSALYEVSDHVAVITLNRPDARNAVNSELASAVGNYLEQANDDPQVRVVILTGAGSGFCAGADLKALSRGENIMPDNPAWGFAGVVEHWIDKPLIAAVNGPAMGGGTELALTCDLVVASDQATFGLPEVKRGLAAAAGGVVRLPNQIAQKRALQMALTGEPVDAATAAAWGLINEVAEHGSELTRAKEIAALIAANAPTAVRETKKALYKATSAGSDRNKEWSGQDPWEINVELIAGVFGHPDAIEGPMAFAQKRAPVWQD